MLYFQNCSNCFIGANNFSPIHINLAGSDVARFDPSNTASTSPTTGALTISGTGGVGIGGSIYGGANLGFHPAASVTPTNNGDVVFQATSNTSFTIKYRGSDGTVRSGSLTLA